MKTSQRIFIVAENALVVNGLKHRIQKRFGNSVELRCFFDFKTCLKNVKKGCEVLVADEHMDGKTAEDVFRSIRIISPFTHGIIHTDAGEVIESLDLLFNSRLASGFAHHPETILN